MGRERPLYFIPRYQIVGDKKLGEVFFSLNSDFDENLTLISF